MKKIKLNKIEEAILSSIILESKSNLDTTLRLLEKKSQFIQTPKCKEYVEQSVRKIQKNINTSDFKTLATNVYVLKETTQQILEKESPIYLIKYPDLSYIKKAKLEALEGESTETVFLTFKITFYPEASSYMELRREMQLLGRKLSAFGHTVINKILRGGKQDDQWPLFIGSGIWESNMPEFLNKKEVNGSVELALDTTSVSMQELKPEVAKLLVAINEVIPQFFGSKISPNKSTTNNDNEDELENNDDEIEDTEDTSIEKEPSLADIKTAEKEFQLSEEAKLIKEKIENLTNKKVILK